MAERRVPGVGVAVLITSPRHPGCVLVGKRRGACGAGTYATPGGHLEFGEEFVECGHREVMEETGLRLESLSYETALNVVWPEMDYHYVDIVLRGTIDVQYKAEPENTEPHKCEGWVWVAWKELSRLQLFRPLSDILAAVDNI